MQQYNSNKTEWLADTSVRFLQQCSYSGELFKINPARHLSLLYYVLQNSAQFESCNASGADVRSLRGNCYSEETSVNLPIRDVTNELRGPFRFVAGETYYLTSKFAYFFVCTFLLTGIVINKTYLFEIADDHADKRFVWFDKSS